MITFDRVDKRFGPIKALDQFSLQVPRGLVCGLIGPNGAGKTTAMSILATLQLPDTGAVKVDGRDVVAEPLEVRGKIGYMPDFFGVYDGLRASEYLEFFAAAYHLPPQGRRRLVEKLLELVNLPDKTNDYVDSLSRGMKQRLALARCLVHDPRVLILDEPASGLDPRARAEMKEIIRGLKQLNKTVLISSHILPELAEICDEVAIIESGKLVVSGKVTEITAFSRGARQFKMEVLEKAEDLAVFMADRAGVSEAWAEGTTVRFLFSGGPADQAGLLQAVVNAGWPVAEFSEIKINLEEAFMAVTNGEVEHHE